MNSKTHLSLLIAFYFFASIGVAASDDGVDDATRINFEFSDLPLKDAISRMTSDFGIPIIYSSELVQNHRVSASCNDCGQEDAVKSLLLEVPLTYKMIGNQFILRRGKMKRGAIHGVVQLKGSSQRIGGIVLFLESYPRNAKSFLATVQCEVDGTFSFKRLKPGRYSISVRSEQFSNVTIDDIVLNAHTMESELLISVEAISMRPEEIRVSQDLSPLSNMMGSTHRLRQSKYSGFTSTPGNSFSRLTRLPGVTAHDWSSADLNIQGSSPRETGVYVDGALIEAPAHFTASGGQSTGMIDQDAIGDMELISGAIPIEYGDRIGGILNMTTSAPREKLETSISTTTIESKVKAAGTFSDDKGSWFVNQRNGDWSYADRFRRMPRGGNASRSARNEDLMGKVQYFFNDTHLLSAHLLKGDSEFSHTDNPSHRSSVFSNTRSHEDSQTTWINLKSFWTSKLWSETVVSSANYDSLYTADAEVEQFYSRNTYDSRGYRYRTIRQDWSWDRGKHFFKWGVKARRSTVYFQFRDVARYSDALRDEAADENADTSDKESPQDESDGDPNDEQDGDGNLDSGASETGPQKYLYDSNGSSREYGAYISDRAQVTEKLEAELAIRYDEQSHTADHQWSPRLNLTYDSSDDTTLRFNWGRFYQSQGIHQLNIHQRQSTYAPATLSEHIVLGLNHLFNKQLALRAEVYSKKFSSLALTESYYNGVFLPRSEFHEGNPTLRSTEGVARGIQLNLRGEPSEFFNWMVNYTMSKAEDRIENRDVPRNWDQRHAINAVLNYNLKNRFHLSAAWFWHTGWPTTEVSLSNIVDENGQANPTLTFGLPNAHNLPDYERLDIRLDQQVELTRGRKFYWYVEVTNFLNHENVTGFDYRIENKGGKYQLLSKPNDYDSFLPIIGMRWDF